MRETYCLLARCKMLQLCGRTHRTALESLSWQRSDCRLGNGINWKSQVFPAMRNYDADNPVSGITNILKRQYQVRARRHVYILTDLTSRRRQAVIATSLTRRRTQSRAALLQRKYENAVFCLGADMGRQAILRSERGVSTGPAAQVLEERWRCGRLDLAHSPFWCCRPGVPAGVRAGAPGGHHWRHVRHLRRRRRRRRRLDQLRRERSQEL